MLNRVNRRVNAINPAALLIMVSRVLLLLWCFVYVDFYSTHRINFDFIFVITACQVMLLL